MVLLTQVSIRYAARFPATIVLIQALCLIGTASLALLPRFLSYGSPELTTWQIIGSRTGPTSIQHRDHACIGMSVSSYETLRYKLQAATWKHARARWNRNAPYKFTGRGAAFFARIAHPSHFLSTRSTPSPQLIPMDPQRPEDTVASCLIASFFAQCATQRSRPTGAGTQDRARLSEIESRVRPRLRYEISRPPLLRFVKVPPLALQTLVENSVKHWFAQRAEGASVQIY